MTIKKSGLGKGLDFLIEKQSVEKKTVPAKPGNGCENSSKKRRDKTAHQ